MGHFEQKPWSMTEKQKQARIKQETAETKEYDFSGAESVFGGADDEGEPNDSKQIKH